MFVNSISVASVVVEAASRPRHLRAWQMQKAAAAYPSCIPQAREATSRIVGVDRGEGQRRDRRAYLSYAPRARVPRPYAVGLVESRRACPSGAKSINVLRVPRAAIMCGGCPKPASLTNIDARARARPEPRTHPRRMGDVTSQLGAGMTHTDIANLDALYKTGLEGRNAREHGPLIYRAMQGQSDAVRASMMKHMILLKPQLFSRTSSARPAPALLLPPLRLEASRCARLLVLPVLRGRWGSYKNSELGHVPEAPRERTDCDGVRAMA